MLIKILKTNVATAAMIGAIMKAPKISARQHSKTRSTNATMTLEAINQTRETMTWTISMSDTMSFIRRCFVC